MDIILEFKSYPELPDNNTYVLIAIKCENTYKIIQAIFTSNKFYDYLNDCMYNANEVYWTNLDLHEQHIELNDLPVIRPEPKSRITYELKRKQ